MCKGWCALDNLPDYAPIITFITNFFKGNTKPLEKEIRQQIEDAINKQHFEWAAKLRDILLHINQFTESQTVVLPTSTTGHILQIKSVGNWWIYVVIYLYQGKVIDVIRQKISQNEYDKESLLINLETEYWTFSLENELYLNTNMKIKKSDRQELELFLDRCFESFVVASSFEEENLMNDLLKTLQSRYALQKFPYRIECLDISHLSGWRASGGLSCMLGGLKYLKGYRRYKVEHGGDDYASLEEVITRRLKNEENYPDLFVLDGGKWQLQIVKTIAKEYPDIQFISLGKGDARKKINIGKSKNNQEITEKIYYFDEKMQIKSIPLVYDQADKLLTSLRDEAHRFANAYRKKQMSKEWK